MSKQKRVAKAIKQVVTTMMDRVMVRSAYRRSIY